MKRTLRLAAGISFGLFAATSALAQTAGSPADSAGAMASTQMGNVQLFAGLRLWANEWDMGIVGQELGVVPTGPSTVVFKERIVSAVSDMEVAPMPTIGARYGNFLASMTYFTPKSYDVEGALSRSVKRSELDVTLGYFVLPSLVVSLGYKRADVNRVTDFGDSKQEITAFLLGVSGSAPLADRLSLYGNFAYGRGHQESEITDVRGDDEYSSTYAIGEVGLSYRLIDANSPSFLKSLSASIGYRVQNYTTQDVGLGTFANGDRTGLISSDTRDIQSSTSGIVVAVVATF